MCLVDPFYTCPIPNTSVFICPQYLHKQHHIFKIPTPFASHAFHPLDGFLQSLPYHLYPFIFPLNKVLDHQTWFPGTRHEGGYRISYLKLFGFFSLFFGGGKYSAEFNTVIVFDYCKMYKQYFIHITDGLPLTFCLCQYLDYFNTWWRLPHPQPSDISHQWCCTPRGPPPLLQLQLWTILYTVGSSRRLLQIPFRPAGEGPTWWHS